MLTEAAQLILRQAIADKLLQRAAGAFDKVTANLQSGTPKPSPIISIYGSVDAFADVERLGSTDFPVVAEALRRWEMKAQRSTSGNGVWNR